jgi:hypothetical protein
MKKTKLINSLAFGKATVAELNDNDLFSVNGGSTIIGGPTCSGCMCEDVKYYLTVMLPEEY